MFEKRVIVVLKESRTPICRKGNDLHTYIISFANEGRAQQFISNSGLTLSDFEIMPPSDSYLKELSQIVDEPVSNFSIVDETYRFV